MKWYNLQNKSKYNYAKKFYEIDSRKKIYLTVSIPWPNGSNLLLLAYCSAVYNMSVVCLPKT